MPQSPEQLNSILNGPPEPERNPVDIDKFTVEQKARLARLQSQPETRNMSIGELARIVLAEEEVERNTPEEE